MREYGLEIALSALQGPGKGPRGARATSLIGDANESTERRQNRMDLMALLIQIVVGVIIIAPILWLAGRVLSGKDKAKFTDAIWIVLLGTVIGAVVGAFVGGLIAAVIMFIVWLALIRHFFDCGWIKALAIAIIAVIIFVVILAILAIIGLGILTLWP
jgi:lysylphosphatidylglycerol synthetase-like protein (DUF2156 family)